jgi:hypothetical protein
VIGVDQSDPHRGDRVIVFGAKAFVVGRRVTLLVRPTEYVRVKLALSDLRHFAGYRIVSKEQ